MSQPNGLPPEGGPPGIVPLPHQSVPEVAAKAVTPSRLGDSVGRNVKMRSYEEIIADEKEKRNILEIKVTRMEVEENGEMKQAKALTTDDVSVLIFEMIGLKPADCLGVALSTNRYDTKEVKLKPGVDASQYLTKDTPIIFKNHEIVVISQTANVTRVTFRNVPFNISA